MILLVNDSPTNLQPAIVHCPPTIALPLLMTMGEEAARLLSSAVNTVIHRRPPPPPPTAFIHYH
jgi:hypothetical protein